MTPVGQPGEGVALGQVTQAVDQLLKVGCGVGRVRQGCGTRLRQQHACLVQAQGTEIDQF